MLIIKKCLSYVLIASPYKELHIRMHLYNYNSYNIITVVWNVYRSTGCDTYVIDIAHTYIYSQCEKKKLIIYIIM